MENVIATYTDVGMMIDGKETNPPGTKFECPTCNGTGKVEEGEHDDIREVDCPDCTDFEDPDFSGATEGDR